MKLQAANILIKAARYFINATNVDDGGVVSMLTMVKDAPVVKKAFLDGSNFACQQTVSLELEFRPV